MEHETIYIEYKINLSENIMVKVSFLAYSVGTYNHDLGLLYSTSLFFKNVQLIYESKSEFKKNHLH